MNTKKFVKLIGKNSLQRVANVSKNKSEMARILGLGSTSEVTKIVNAADLNIDHMDLRSFNSGHYFVNNLCEAKKCIH